MMSVSRLSPDVMNRFNIFIGLGTSLPRMVDYVGVNGGGLLGISVFFL